MKVREIVQDTEWLPGRVAPDHRPAVSVILPTYRRGRSGLFLQAARSVLDQTFRNLELIVVDDASTDGTRDQIEELMAADGRVSCLRHPYNVGLPAISEYEAFLKARGDFIAFAFDDDIFEKDAIAALHSRMNAIDCRFLYGWVEMHVIDPVTGEFIAVPLGRAMKPQANIRVMNFIPNNAVMLHREVFETVGLYDPTPAMARVCDWDLWNRVAEGYELRFADVRVGVVQGPATTDSLGVTYGMEPWAINELMRRDRTASLRPTAFGEIDVLAVPEGLTAETRRTVLDLNGRFLRRYESARGGRVGPRPTTGLPDAVAERPRILASTLCYDATTALCFENVPGPACVRVISPNEWPKEELVHAAAYVAIRDLFGPNRQWIEAARRMGIPTYWFIDDNFMVLKDEVADLSGYSLGAVQEIVAGFAGILTTTEALRQYCVVNDLHDNVLLYPPICPSPRMRVEAVLPAKSAETLRVLFFGGGHRREALQTLVVPALEMLAAGRTVELIVGGEPPTVAATTPLRLTTFPFEIDYRLALSRFMHAGIDVVVHPASQTRNARFKTLNALINATIIGAPLLVSDTPPYDETRDADVMGYAEDTVAGWRQTLASLAADADRRRALVAAASAYCRRHFDGGDNANVMRSLADRHPAPDSVEIDRRWRVFADWSRRGQTRPAAPLDSPLPPVAVAQAFEAGSGDRLPLARSFEKHYLRPLLRPFRKIVPRRAK